MFGKSDDYEKCFRQSESVEQQEYEKSMFMGGHLGSHHSTDDGTRDEEDKSHSSVKDKVKGLWNDKVKPAFPEAVADISIIEKAIKVERSVKQNINNVVRYPEVLKVAEVRKGLDLGLEERRFLDMRKVHVRNSFAQYLNLDPAEVHPEDVPIIGFGGSGGGFRAMIGVLGYCQKMKQTGLWDLFTYVAGVSGACWSLAAYYTFGKASMERVIENCKERLHPHHPLSSDAIRKLLTAPDSSYVTLGPLVQKHYSGLHTVAMDFYSVFITGYIFLHQDPPSTQDVAGLNHDWYKWTSAREHLENGEEPLPIITAIRHERPWKDWEDKDQPFKEPDHSALEHKAAKDAWFQWYEMTPFEVGCDELEAWVPTWGFGRPYVEGKSTMQLPEQSLSLLLGLATGAPAGPLSSYISTIKRQLPPGFIGNTIEDIASKITHFWGKQGTEEFQNHHPLHASNEHNFVFHLTKLQQGQFYPSGIENSPRIHLVDSGMDNNCPTYVLLHPSREVDVILNMDASSDVQKDTFQERVDQIGSRRGLKFTKRSDIKAGTDKNDPDRFKGLYAQVYDGKLIDRPPTVVDSYGNTVTNPPAPICHHECTMVYMPLLPNERAVPDFDPSTAKFSGSYNLVWTPEQIDMLVRVCIQNFKNGEETIKTTLMEAWMKKKEMREAAEAAKAGN
ncbi:lysophospholipase-1 [Coleophoma crateriformis]|uniref:Lysophospholipase n=1 Tax=Coleophoma crateriformis TaxID=565419 RepID=A0A3D8SM18_9HELO|nr:lysophospholipase-1 [Coleophoma crateriformis]